MHVDEGVLKLTLVEAGRRFERHLQRSGSLVLHLLEQEVLAPVEAAAELLLLEEDSVEALRPVQVTIF